MENEAFLGLLGARECFHTEPNRTINTASVVRCAEQMCDRSSPLQQTARRCRGRGFHHWRLGLLLFLPHSARSQARCKLPAFASVAFGNLFFCFFSCFCRKFRSRLIYLSISYRALGVAEGQCGRSLAIRVKIGYTCRNFITAHLCWYNKLSMNFFFLHVLNYLLTLFIQEASSMQRH